MRYSPLRRLAGRDFLATISLRETHASAVAQPRDDLFSNIYDLAWWTCNMAEAREIALPGGRHTNYSDEVWFLIISPGTAEIVLEARFQSDAIGRTGFPSWSRTDYCASRKEDEAVCRVPFDNVAELLAAARFSFIPERVWARARAECRDLSSGTRE